jgi:hypothetical protein
MCEMILNLIDGMCNIIRTYLRFPFKKERMIYSPDIENQIKESNLIENMNVYTLFDILYTNRNGNKCKICKSEIILKSEEFEDFLKFKDLKNHQEKNNKSCDNAYKQLEEKYIFSNYGKQYMTRKYITLKDHYICLEEILERKRNIYKYLFYLIIFCIIIYILYLNRTFFYKI